MFKSVLSATLVKHAPPPERVRHRLRRVLLAVQLGRARRQRRARRDGGGRAPGRRGVRAAGAAPRCRARSWRRCCSTRCRTWTATRCAGSRRWRCQQFAGMEPGRPVGGTYYLYRTLRQLDLDDLQQRLMDQARERGEIEEGELADRLAHEEFQARLQGAARAHRGGDPPPAGRRPRGRGDGAHAAQAAARGHRVHARLARGDARAAAGDLPADPRRWRPGSRSAAASATAATSTSARPSASRCRTAACPRSRSSRTRTRRSPRSWSSPTSPVRSRASPGSRCSSSTRWRASSRRCGRGCSSTASTRSRGSSRSPTTSPTRCSG